MTQALPFVVRVTQDAVRLMQDAGRAALPRETGGILVGFRADDQVVITRALLVHDPASTRYDYELKTDTARTQLAALRRDAPDVVGYVGDWHTHPANVPPSRTDISSLKAASRRATDTLVLLIVSFRGNEVGPLYASVARRHDGGRSWKLPKIDISTPAVEISQEESSNLEQCAQIAWVEDEDHEP